MTALRAVNGLAIMDKNLDGPWKESEQWIRDTNGSDFPWLLRPHDSPADRKMVVSLVLKDIERNGGVFPEKPAFIGGTLRRKVKI
ncbi:MAG: hypothetical protein ACE5HC_16260 [Candidatus Binatia bacterium]